MTDQTETRRAPVQGYSAGIPWEMHLRAYDAYCQRYRKQQALIEGGCRGGFGTVELDEFIPGWRDEAALTDALDRAKKAEAQLATITAGLALEYVRVPEWCTGLCSDQHSAMVAIRCVATRLGVYGQLDDKIDELLMAARAALGEQT